MNKYIFLAVLTATTFGSMNANAVNSADKCMGNGDESFAEVANTMSTAYIENAVIPSWRDNWFVNVQGGANAFIGSPLGCGDLFDRIKPTLQIGVGKWHTPSIGNRLVFQGFKWKAGDFSSHKIRHYHADLMLNLSSMIGLSNGNGRWDIIPFVGLGLIDNRTAQCSPFAINYGLQGRFKVANRFHITAEFNNATTFKNADGNGNPRLLGDNLMSLTAGLSWTFGRHAGFKKIVDAKPFIAQNERLISYAYAQRDRNEQLRRANDANAKIIAELRKILSIEGLLDKYNGVFGGQSVAFDGYPVNDYSGLNSLKERLKNAKNGADFYADDKNKRSKPAAKGKENNGNSYEKSKDKILGNHADATNKNAQAIDSISAADVAFANEYLSRISADGECIGAPIYFFFKLGSSQLVDESQLANIDEIARIARKYDLLVDIEGAADAATGSKSINSSLGSERSQFIKDCLIQRGLNPDNCQAQSIGGITDYSPEEANRNAIVRLYLR